MQFPHFFRAAAALTLKCRKRGQHKLQPYPSRATLSLPLSLLAFWQCQLSEIYTEIQQMLHCAVPSSPRRESLTHLPFGSARAELKFMASFWVSGCRGQTCACTFPSRHNMWHIPRQAGGACTCHAPPPWGNSQKRRKVVQLVDFRFFGQPFCCRVEFKQ